MAAGDLATEQQIRRLYAVLHSIGKDPKDFKEEKGFSSYAKLTRQEISDLITELEGIESERMKLYPIFDDTEYEDLEREYETENPGKEHEENERIGVKKMVQLYAKVWREILGDKIFSELDPRERGYAAAGIFRELMKDKRTERIGELQNNNQEEEE